MKRLWLALAILALLSCLSTLHVVTLAELTGRLTDLLTRAEEQVEGENWSAAEALTRQALEEWERYDLYLHAVLRHEDIDGVLSSFYQVLAYLEGSEPQPSEYAAANAQLLTGLRLLIEEEVPSLKNIL